MGRGQLGLGWSKLCPILGGTRAQGSPAVPYPGVREELGVVGASLGLPCEWDKELNRVMQGFTFAACTWVKEALSI